MKYYLYISTAKLELLFPQVPRSLWERLAVDAARIKTKYLDVVIKPKDEQATRIYMLNRVISQLEKEEKILHLEKDHQIDSVDTSKEYVHGKLEMRWMHLADAPGVATHRVGMAGYQDRIMHLQAEPGIIFWAGYHPQRMEDNAHTVVGLGGSVKHMIRAGEVEGRTDTGAPGSLIGTDAR